MIQDDRHLSVEQIECLLDTALLQPDGHGSVLSDQARQHLATCEACQRLVSMHQEFHRALLRLGHAELASSTSACPSARSLNELAAGLVRGRDAEEMLTHALQCDHCGPLLREAVDVFASPDTHEETEALKALQSSDAQWQSRLAQELASVSAEDSRRSSFRFPPSGLRWLQAVPLWTYAAAAVVAFASAGVSILVWHSRPAYTDSLLAQAYTEHRTLEVRIPGAKYAPMRVERGAGASSLDRPPSLLKAEAFIGEYLRKTPNDPAWLQARARADLLDGNYDSAIKSLQRALDVRPDSPLLLADLGSAYFARADAANRPIDYGNAVEALGKTLAKTPDDPIALFNRALACERMLLYTQAIDDWEHYLRVDPTGPWAEDARERLAALKQKVNQRQKSYNEPLLAPGEFARSDSGLLDERIEDRIEDYLYAAVADWLPKAYPARGRATLDFADYRKALAQIASTAAQSHRDRWLQHLLASASSPHFPAAVAELSEAVRSNETGDNELARQHAAAAERLFISAGENAGALRARVEYVFASHDAQEGDACLRAAETLNERLANQPYSWLRTQFAIERGTCFWFVGNLGAARESYQEAEREAQASHYRVIFLRTQDHLAAFGIDTGDFVASAARTHRALTDFWSGHYPPMRGYNLYFNIYESSRLTDRPHLQVAAWRDGLGLSDSFHDNVLRAMAHSDMADAALGAGMPFLAEQELSKARDIFVECPQIKSIRTAGIEAETRLAAVEASQGRAAEAASRLREFSPAVSALSDDVLQILFYATAGDADSRIGRDQEADSYLHSAVTLAENQLRSLHGDKARIDWERRSSSAYRSLIQLQLKQGGRENALELWELYRGSALRAGSANPSLRVAGTTFTEPGEVAARLPTLTKETVVSYALLPQGLAIWIYDNRGVFGHWIDLAPGDLEAKAQRLRNLCSNPDSDRSALQQTARELYGLLVGPIEDRLSSDRLLAVELDDHLAGIPFEALIDREGRYFGERVAISLSLGLYYRNNGRSSSPITKELPALVAAVPESSALGDTLLPALSDADSESQMVAAAFRSPQLLTGDSATGQAILSRLPSAVVFHFAGHALSSERQSGLLLSDSFLTARDLQTASLARLRLAVLSACATQAGSEGGAYDSDSLVRIFLRSGVPDVVATRWNVDSVATRKFMELFYQSLLTGSSPAEATRRAQASLRSLPGTGHPYFWSAFGSFGLV